ncbi:MAG: lantibiotic dehydratase [Candidatus Eisenbacteria bacterium]
MIERSPRVLVRVAGAPMRELERWAAPACSQALRDLEAAEHEGESVRCRLETALYELAGEPGSDPSANRLRLLRLAVRRSLHGAREVSPDELAAAIAAGDVADPRVGAYLDARARWETARAAVDVAWQEHEARLRAEVRSLAADAGFREALWLAGPELASAAARLLARDPAAWRARERQVAETLVRYAARRASKTTPHGTFCSTAIGQWGAQAEIDGDARPVCVRVRLHVAQARRVVEEALADPAIALALGSRLNPSLERATDAWEFWRPARLADEDALERRIRLGASPAVDALIEHLRGLRADAGASVARSELLAWAQARAGGDPGPWLNRLVESGLLQVDAGVSHLEGRPLRALARSLRDAPGMPAQARARAEAQEAVEGALDALDLEPDPATRQAAYERIERAARALPGGAPRAGETLVRADAACELRVRLPESVGAELERILPRYARWFAALYPGALLLAPWVERFLARHPADREIALSALWHGTFDQVTSARGGSFPEPGRVAPGAAPEGIARAQAAHERWREWVARRADACGPGGDVEIRLEDADWDALAGDTPPPRFACGVLFQGTDWRGDPGPGRVVWNALYGAGLATARLTELHRDPSGAGSPLAEDLREGWSWLERDGAIIAEIPYAHSGRTANAGLRPRVFDHEIGCPGEIPGPGATVLPLSDLLVRWDARAERFVLRSRRLDRRVVPVLPNGLSPEGVIAFLVAVGQQDLQPLALFPDAHPARPGELPRIVSGTTILFRRRYRLGPEGARAAFAPSNSDRDCHAAALRWQRESGAPRHVFVASDGQTKPQFVDFESPALTRILAEAARGGTGVTVREMLPGPADGWAPLGMDPHALEFLAHVRRTGPAA